MNASPSAGASRRARARRGQGDQLRGEILAAAEALLSEADDEAALSIRAVAHAVGVTPPSIYLHFRDRTDLVVAVCQKRFRELDQHMQRAVEGIEDPSQRLEVRGRAYIAFGLANPEHYRILMMGRPGHGPRDLPDRRLAGTDAFQHLLDDVTAAIEEHHLDQDPIVAACALWIAVHGATSLFIAQPDFPWPDRDELIDHVVASALRSLRPT